MVTLLLLVALLALSACASTQPVEGTVDLPRTTQAPEAPETTQAPEAPETTEAPATTTASVEEGDEGIPPEAIWLGLGILLILLLVLLVGFFMGRSGTASSESSKDNPPSTSDTLSE